MSFGVHVLGGVYRQTSVTACYLGPVVQYLECLVFPILWTTSPPHHLHFHHHVLSNQLPDDSQSNNNNTRRHPCCCCWRRVDCGTLDSITLANNKSPPPQQHRLFIQPVWTNLMRFSSPCQPHWLFLFLLHLLLLHLQQNNNQPTIIPEESATMTYYFSLVFLCVWKTYARQIRALIPLMDSFHHTLVFLLFVFDEFSI